MTPLAGFVSAGGAARSQRPEFRRELPDAEWQALGREKPGPAFLITDGALQMDKKEDPIVIPVIDEELVPGSTRIEETGAVRIHKKVDRVGKTIEVPAIHDDAEITRVPVNRVIESLPDIRQSGEVLIIPVVEEEIVVQKRLVLKEEIHVRHRRTRQHVTKEVYADRERAVIERIDAEGRVIARSDPDASDTDAKPPLPSGRRH